MKKEAFPSIWKDCHLICYQPTFSQKWEEHYKNYYNNISKARITLLTSTACFAASWWRSLCGEKQAVGRSLLMPPLAPSPRDLSLGPPWLHLSERAKDNFMKSLTEAYDLREVNRNEFYSAQEETCQYLIRISLTLLLSVQHLQAAYFNRWK